MADAVFSSESDKTQLDLMFMHCGGKQRIPVAARALTSLEVPFAVVMDFDALREEEPLCSLFELCGGEWLKIERDYNTVRSSIDAKKPEIGTEEIRSDINQELAGVKDSIFPKASSERIQKILRRASPWALAKSLGKAYVPPGDASRAFADLIDALERQGVFIVPVGDLESFDRSVAGHGPKWVNGALAKSLTTDSELEEARKFVRRIVEFVMARSGGISVNT